MAAAPLMDDEVGCEFGSSSSPRGTGRRKGVRSSKWWIGEPSEGSLLKLWLRRCDGYGEPHCVASYCPSSAELPGGVLSSPAIRSGSRGAGRGGSSGDASPSAVEALERACEDPGDCECCRTQVILDPSRADARGGVCGGDDFGEDVFNDPAGAAAISMAVINKPSRACLVEFGLADLMVVLPCRMAELETHWDENRADEVRLVRC